MKIGIFVIGAFCSPKYTSAISGHVQIPLKAAKILAERGHQVTLITTRPHETDVLIGGLERDVSVYIVEHASRNWPGKGVQLSKLPKHTWQLFSFLRRESFDIIHFFGGNNTGLILGFLKRIGIKSRAFFSPIKGPTGASSGLLARAAFSRVDKFIATTGYVRGGWGQLYGNGRCGILHAGVFKNIARQVQRNHKNSVLFWRNADYENGADLAMASFVDLAPKYPDIRFVFAVRPHDVLEKELLELEKKAANIDVHIYPYNNGTTLESLLQSALFVVQPFRSLSINPQMSILETLYSGVPVIATGIESNEELIESGDTGLVIPPEDKNALTEAIMTLLDDSELCEKMAKNARAETEAIWNWESFGKELVEIYEDSNS